MPEAHEARDPSAQAGRAGARFKASAPPRSWAGVAGPWQVAAPPALGARTARAALPGHLGG